MFDIELLRGFYRGTGVKIAMIDTGMKEEYDNSYRLKRYFFDYNDGCIKSSVDHDHGTYSLHGSLCGAYILDIAPEVILLDINVENDNREISEDAVCAAIEFAVESECDIINISLGFENYSEKLYFACKRAYEEKSIIIAAASNNNAPMFPADFGNYTVKIVEQAISERSEEHEKIVRVSDRLYQIYLNPYIKDMYDEDSGGVKSIVSFGSSIACVFFSAILALYLESRPFISKEEIIELLFGQGDINTNFQNEHPEFEIREKSILAIISSYYDPTKYIDLINPNIIGYYDLLQRKKIFFEDEDGDSDNLYIVNPLNYQRFPIINTGFKNISYVGEFVDVNCYCGKIPVNNDRIKNISTPIILIAGVGTDCGKLHVQLELRKQMLQNDLSNYCITYNPLGSIFGMDYLKYPDNIPFHELICSLNGYISKIENEADEEYESIIINVAGGMFPLSRINTNHFGMLYNAYLNALPLDYIILCTNSGVDPLVVQKEIKRLELLGNTNISIVISDLSYDELSVENSDKNIPHMEDKMLIKKGVEEYKRYIKNIEVFEFSEVVDGLLYRDIMNKMT